MSKRGTGVAFIAIAAFLISAKYISAATLGSGVSNLHKGVFISTMHYVGIPLSLFSIISLIIGVGYIAWGEYEEFKSKKQ